VATLGEVTGGANQSRRRNAGVETTEANQLVGTTAAASDESRLAIRRQLNTPSAKCRHPRRKRALGGGPHNRSAQKAIKPRHARQRLDQVATEKTAAQRDLARARRRSAARRAEDTRQDGDQRGGRHPHRVHSRSRYQLCGAPIAQRPHQAAVSSSCGTRPTKEQ